MRRLRPEAVGGALRGERGTAVAVGRIHEPWAMDVAAGAEAAKIVSPL